MIDYQNQKSRLPHSFSVWKSLGWFTNSSILCTSRTWIATEQRPIYTIYKEPCLIMKTSIPNLLEHKPRNIPTPCTTHLQHTGTLTQMLSRMQIADIYVPVLQNTSCAKSNSAIYFLTGNPSHTHIRPSWTHHVSIVGSKICVKTSQIF
jgi:hypothetical protein